MVDEGLRARREMWLKLGPSTIRSCRRDQSLARACLCNVTCEPTSGISTRLVARFDRDGAGGLVPPSWPSPDLIRGLSRLDRGSGAVMHGLDPCIQATWRRDKPRRSDRSHRRISPPGCPAQAGQDALGRRAGPASSCTGLTRASRPRWRRDKLRRSDRLIAASRLLNARLKPGKTRWAAARVLPRHARA
jgi:hypothetical protein